jgi:hypothetical protein
MTEELDTNIADFIVNHTYLDYDVIPMAVILSGSRAYGCARPESDYDFLGIHLANTWDCLEHPRYQQTHQVINLAFTKEQDPISIDSPDAMFSITSFEMWKFIDIWQKGAFAAYELLFLPTIHSNPAFAKFEHLFRQGLTNKLGFSAKHSPFHIEHVTSRQAKANILTIYRLIQASHFLNQEEFEWNYDRIMNSSSSVIQELMQRYKTTQRSTFSISELDLEDMQYEYNGLVAQVEQNMQSTRIASQCSDQVLAQILSGLRYLRSSFI